MVLPGYFEAMEIPLRRGRAITAADRPGSQLAVVINQTLAERHWPGGNAIGKIVRFWRSDFEIVGVVQDTHDFGQEVRPMGFVAATLEPLREVSMVLRSTQNPTALVSAVRSTVAKLDPALPIYDVRTMTDLMAHGYGDYAVMPRLMAGLAAIALVLGLIGVYGVIARSVSRRTQEVAIRMVLGAQRWAVLGPIMRQGVAVVGIGVALGLAISAAVTRSLALFLFGVNPLNALTFGLVALILYAAGLVATFIPARRAILVNPTQALRNE